MPHNWRAPACYVSVALICMLYIWIMPFVGLTDLFAGAGIGAALMWALNDWEVRQQAKQHRSEARVEPASVVMSRLRAMARAARGLEGTVPSAGAPRDNEEMRRLARAAGALDDDATSDTLPRQDPKPATKRETPIEAWRREVRKRDIDKMEAQLRALAEQPEAEPYGAPDHRPADAPRRDVPDRWQRPARSRSFPR
jgi:hypothetical protein